MKAAMQDFARWPFWPALLILFVAVFNVSLPENIARAAPASEPANAPNSAFGPPNKAAQKLVNKGLKHSNAGDYAAAIPFFTQAIESDPGNNNVCLYRLNAYRGLKQHDLALRDCEAMIQAAPDSPFGFLNRGFVLQSANRIDEALEDFERVKTMDPKSIAADICLAQILAKKGRQQQALQKINAVIQSVPPPAIGFVFLRGQIYLSGADFTNALVDFDAVIKHDKNQFGAHYYRAKSLQLAGRNAEALEAYEAFHHRLTSARRAGSKGNQIVTALLTSGLIGAGMLLDDPPRGFTTSYDAMDAEAIKAIEELSSSKP